MKKDRIFAILNWHSDRVENVSKEIVEKLKLKDGDKLLLFFRKEDYKDGSELPDVSVGQNVVFIPISEEDGHNRAAGLNFVYKHLKENYSGAYAHVIYDSIQFKKDPTQFFDAIEEMMGKLHLDIWFNTYTDVCNFVFSKFDGRVSICINEPSLKQIYDKTIIWTSHANPNYSIVDLDEIQIPENGKVFDDRFEIPMFWIIRFLCERARDKKGFMNHYPTIPDEIGVYKTGEFKGLQTTPQQMQKEDAMFSELKLDHTPNQNVEALMDFMIERLMKK